MKIKYTDHFILFYFIITLRVAAQDTVLRKVLLYYNRQKYNSIYIY